MMALRSKFEPWMKKLVKVPAVGSYLGIPVPKVLPNLFPHDLAICRYYALMRKQRREGLLPPEEPLLQEFKFTVPCGETTNQKNQDVAKFSKSSPRNMDGIS